MAQSPNLGFPAVRSERWFFFKRRCRCRCWDVLLCGLCLLLHVRYALIKFLGFGSNSCLSLGIPCLGLGLNLLDSSLRQIESFLSLRESGQAPALLRKLVSLCLHL